MNCVEGDGEFLEILTEYISSDTKMNLAQNPGTETNEEVVGAYREIRRSIYKDNESPYRVLRGVSANGDLVGADEHHQFRRYEYLLLESYQRRSKLTPNVIINRQKTSNRLR